jgi:hypothetical protein
MAIDVFEHDAPRPTLADDALNVGPKVARVGLAAAPAGGREWLTRVARSDDIHDAAPRAAVEGFKVVPDRRLT